ncbi:MAG: site-specific DNA-methyltransferase, partial [Firmicutes bacterium]|nr:site-specific DNA-methyltransferase [Bacillota bacterium]
RIDGYHFWVVGNRTVKLEKVHTDQILIELAQKHGLEFVCNFGREISNKVMPQRNSPTNKNGAKVETMTKEHIVVFRKVA